jgi:hypothetical protein
LSANERGLLVGEKATQSVQREITLAAKPMPILDFEGNFTKLKIPCEMTFVNSGAD